MMGTQGRSGWIALLVLCAGALLAFGTEAAHAQAKTRIWDVALGTPVGNLPVAFMLPSCGTNGGPPSTRLNTFADFARCPVDAGTGLREIWFTYDNESEYIQRALRAPPAAIGAYLANQVFGRPVIFSVLVDAAGLMQGYRIISDPREPAETRMDANVVAGPFRATVFGPGEWACSDLPRRPGEEPFGGQFVKEYCKKVADGRHITLETHVYLKPGQGFVPGRPEAAQPNEFEVSVRVEVVNPALVR